LIDAHPNNAATLTDSASIGEHPPAAGGDKAIEVFKTRRAVDNSAFRLIGELGIADYFCGIIDGIGVAGDVSRRKPEVYRDIGGCDT
jgi:hypothetical protein